MQEGSPVRIWYSARYCDPPISQSLSQDDYEPLSDWVRWEGSDRLG